MLSSIKSCLFKLVASLLLLSVIMFSSNIKDSYYRHEVGSNVVRIFNMEKTGSGTGFHIQDASGNILILTNKHVCAIADKDGNVLVEQNGEEIPRKVIERYKHHDLCLVEALPGHTGSIDIASSETLGEDLILIGHPGGRDLTLSHGEYIGKSVIMLGDNVEKEEDCIDGKVIFTWGGLICLKPVITSALSAPSYGGNSGSPVVNKYGNVIGVLFAGQPGNVNNSHMVPLKYIRDFLGL